MRRAKQGTFPCLRCGRPMRRTPSGRGGPARNPLELRCPRCRYLIYDYPRPCAGVVVMKRDRVLVLVRAHQPRKGYLDTPGGFIDAGEDIETAARRELLEETGLTVGRCVPLGLYWDRYYLRGFGYIPTMNFYYLARWRSGEPRAADDAASVEWMPLSKVGRTGVRLSFEHMRAVIRDVRARVRRAK